MMETIRTFLTTHEETRLLAGFLTWILIGWWMWLRGWKIQRRYLIEAGLTPLPKGNVWWSVVIIGAIFVISSQQRPASPAVVSVAMLGVLSAYVDWRTHRLPDSYTRMMGCGVAVGVILASLMSDTPLWILTKSIVGALIWLIPLWILSRLPGGVGQGDVKLAPVLGAMLGVLGIEAPVSGLIVSIVAAGLAALWNLVARSAATDSRMALGPWLIGGAVISHLLWGVLPDWI